MLRTALGPAIARFLGDASVVEVMLIRLGQEITKPPSTLSVCPVI